MLQEQQGFIDKLMDTEVGEIDVKNAQKLLIMIKTWHIDIAGHVADAFTKAKG